MFAAVTLVATGMLLMGMGKAPEAGEVPRMTAQELKGQLGTPDLVILDVRKGKDWEESDRMISGALRADPKSPGKWTADYPKGKTIVLYCA
ncbi:MAG: hypothetical protein C0617_09905 [Desulfuromonas sp.]|nr:MAG: hypothetical protein C0617_09905 [Desulfuromonas sp.]